MGALRARALAWFVHQPTLIGVRALVVYHDQVLLIRHRGGGRPWSLPGGGVERYERLDEAIRREIREESGVLVRVERLQGMYDAFFGRVTNYIAVFVCTPLSEPKPPISLEIADARFFALDSLPEGVDYGSLARIDEYRSGAVGLSALWLPPEAPR
jgi:ADP-ribose pyrophosphatase YjhB (NUDIX family)